MKAHKKLNTPVGKSEDLTLGSELEWQYCTPSQSRKLYNLGVRLPVCPPHIAKITIYYLFRFNIYKIWSHERKKT